MTMIVDGEKRDFLKKYLALRQRGRTDLLFLCQTVLGYIDVTPADARGENHGPLIDGLHQFAGRDEEGDIRTMAVTYSVPKVAMWDQVEPDGKRNYLFLYPRDHLKTTVVTLANAIQWILNYEDVRIMLSASTGQQKNQLMAALLGHFRSNPKLRYLYPEWCPPIVRASDWGSLESFVIPNRTRQIKEPTVMAITIGQTIAGSHNDVHIHSDLVDKENVKTAEQIVAVNAHFGYTDPMLAVVSGQQGWRYVEGTRYDYSDLYGVILDTEAAREEKDKTYRIIVRSAEVDQKTQRTLWPARYDWAALQKKKHNPHMSRAMFECQYNQNVIPPSGGLISPEKVETLWITRELVRQLMPRYRIHTTVDLAQMDEKSAGAFEAIVTCGFLPSGAIHVIDVVHGHLSPKEVIDALFDQQRRFRPIDFKIEETHHVQTLAPFLYQEMDKRHTYLNVKTIPRSNTASKDNRIAALQGFFESNRIRIVDDLPCDNHLILELTRWPKFAYKDILDALSDQLQHADGDGVEPDLHPVAPEDRRDPLERAAKPLFQGFDPFSHRATFLRLADESGGASAYHEGTGL